MLKFFKKSILVLMIVIITGCVGAMPKYKSSNSQYIVFKTANFAYADMGFISKASSEVKVEIYSNGQAVMRLRVTPSQVCMSRLKCMSAESFNKEILSANYPADTLYNIFSAKEIFNGKSKKILANGFIQKIGSINYIVSANRVSFKDSSTGIKIIIR